VVSFGDLIIAFGLVDATFWASRRVRRARTLAPPRAVATSAAGDRPDDDEVSPEVTFAATANAEAVVAPESEAEPEPETPRRPAHVGIGRARAVARSGRGARSGRSRAGASTVAIKDALERLEGP
jgi:hypothetical protein